MRLHRAELYDAIGPGMHPCHHCGDLVEWGITIDVDHLDHNRQNNRLENLAVACRGCQNRQRRFCLSKNSARPEAPQ
ncbi:MAG TPA: HNH endonuclease [Thermoleophilaceae bacterium]|nr:HNH endonuclease [Thermoleophilaceae bacterium]